MQGPPTLEDQYWSLLESTQRFHYPKFVTYLSHQPSSQREEGRAAVVNFRDRAKPSVHLLPRSKDLRDCLDKPLEPDAVSRRLFILEGLPKNFVLLLGSRLRVPPSFFSAHWVDSEKFMGVLVNRSPRHYDNPHQFQLSFAKLHRATIETGPDDDSKPIYRTNTSIRRSLSRLTIFGDLDGPLASSDQASFWGTPPTLDTSGESSRDDESWDAILLVDPPLGGFAKWEGIPRKISRDPSTKLFNSPRINQEGSWYPLFQSQTVLSQNSAEWQESEQCPKMISLFDDMLTLYPLTERTSTSELNRCTDICRRLVLSEWTARLRTIEAQIVLERTKMSIGDVSAARNTKESLILPWARLWNPKDFSRLVRATAVLKSIDAELRCNLDSLGLSGSEPCTLDPWEIAAWQSLREAIQRQIYIVDDTMQSYMQAISVRQSLNAGYLTSMATIFIPVSLVAAVFSMGGEFAAGESLFWVFWVVAIPVTLFGCFLLFTKSGTRLFKRMSAEKSLV